MKAAIVFLALLAAASAQTYFLQMGFADVNCNTKDGASATISGPSTASGNNGNSMCQFATTPPSAGSLPIYQTCQVTGNNANITVTTYLCSSNTPIAVQVVPNNVCVGPSQQLPNALTAASKYQCLSTGTASYASFSPKVEGFFTGGCAAPSPVAVTPSIGTCFRQQTTNPYITISNSGNTLAIGYNCTLNSGSSNVCDVCQQRFSLTVDPNECAQSQGYDTVFGYPTANTYYRVSRTGAANGIVPMIAATVVAVLAAIAVSL